MEVLNIGAVSFPAAVDRAIRDGLEAGETFREILKRAGVNIEQQVTNLADAYNRLLLPPAPYYSVLMSDCLEHGQDLSHGARYVNFGIHGAGSANAADALAVVQRFVFDERRVSPRELLVALEANYEGHEELRNLLADHGPKTGNNDEAVDALLVQLFDFFADACEAYGRTAVGGILRPGTGSAMYYVWLARGQERMREPVVGATADGRRAGEMLSANLAPAPGINVLGPISMLQSYAKLNYRRVCNGGPITMELADTVFRSKESVRKVALLVRAFAQLGCQQLQLNTLNVDTLLDAKAHPSRHRNLIVRVWGWSGYFCELGPEYQDHIIARHVYG